MRRTPRRIRSGLTTLTGTGAGASAVLALLVIASVFIAVSTPRESLAFRTRALQRVFQAAPVAARSVVATADYTSLSFALGLQPGASGQGISTSQIDAVTSEITRNLAAEGLPLQPASAQWSGLASGYSQAPDAARSAYFGSTPPQVEILFREMLGQNSRIIAGHAPARDSLASEPPRFQVAVTAATAARFGLHVGSALGVNGIRLTVSGIVRPVHPGSLFWAADPNAAAANFTKTKSGGYWLGAVFVGRSELADLENPTVTGQMTLLWEFPLALGGVNANEAGALSDGLGGALTRSGVLTRSVALPASLAVSSGMVGPLADFVTTEGQIGSLLSLLYVSLTLVGAVVLMLGGRLLAERRVGEFRLMRARGAARRQLTVLALRAGVVVVLPAAAVGAAIAVALTPGGDEPIAWWLGVMTTLVGLVSVPVLAVRRVHATGLADDRTDTSPSRAVRAKRLVADFTLVAAAVAGLVVLRQQGLPAPGSTDWLTSAAPVLVAVPMAIVVVRAYPLVVRWLVRLASRRCGVTAFIGLARAARTSLTAALPAFALVLVLTLIAFGATLRAAVVRGDVAATWRAIGADVVIDASHSDAALTSRVQHAIAGVPGVRRTAALSVLSGVAADGTTLGVVVVSPASYAALIAETPQQPFPAAALAEPVGHASSSSPLPALASPAAAALLGRGAKILVGISGLRIRVVGPITSTPGSANTGPFIVLPSWAMARALGASQPQPSLLLVVGPGVDARQIQAVVRRSLPGSTVTFRSRLLDSLMGEPLPHGIYVVFAQGAAAAAGFGAVIVLIMLALGARPRELTLARLITMGLSPSQARRLVITETLPSILAATAGGTACAWALVPLIGPAIDLSPLTGTSVPVPVRADFAVLGYLAAALLVLALATLFAQSAATRLRGVTRALRVGE